MLGARVDPSVYDLYQTEAIRLGRSVSDLAREALENFIGLAGKGGFTSSLDNLTREVADLKLRVQVLEDHLSLKPVSPDQVSAGDTSTQAEATPDTPPAACPRCGGTTWNKSGWDRKSNPPKRRWECRSCGKRVSV